jgi:hypothetical protein
VLRAACCVLRAARCVLRAACCVLRHARQFDALLGRGAGKSVADLPLAHRRLLAAVDTDDAAIIMWVCRVGVGCGV